MRHESLAGGMWQTGHTAKRCDAAGAERRNRTKRRKVKPAGIRDGGSSISLPNIGSTGGDTGRCEGAKAEKAVPFPGAARRSVLLGVAALNPFCEGIDYAWGMEGITARFEPTHGETQDGLSTPTSSSVTLPCGARRISWPPLAARSPCLRSAAAFPADLRYACGPSSPAPAPRARLARCVAAPPSD